jgi:hypothetical protein
MSAPPRTAAPLEDLAGAGPVETDPEVLET